MLTPNLQNVNPPQTATYHYHASFSQQVCDNFSAVTCSVVHVYAFGSFVVFLFAL